MALRYALVALALTALHCGTSKQPCGDTCGGCCDAAGQCQPGTAAHACGTGAALCVSCQSSQLCQLGVCVAGGSGDAGTPCSGPLLPNPQVCPDHAAVSFRQEFGGGTFVGTQAAEVIALRNRGLAPLQISAISVAGDRAFSALASTTPPVSVPSDQVLYVSVRFAPDAAVASSGVLTVLSNAENAPSLSIALSGCGVPTDGGPSACRDGG